MQEMHNSNKGRTSRPSLERGLTQQRCTSTSEAWWALWMRSLALHPLVMPPLGATAHRATRRPRVWAEAGAGHGSLRGAGPGAGMAGMAGWTLVVTRGGTGLRGWALGGRVRVVRCWGLVRLCTWCRYGLWRMARWAGLGSGMSVVQDAHDRQ